LIDYPIVLTDRAILEYYLDLGDIHRVTENKFENFQLSINIGWSNDGSSLSDGETMVNSLQVN
jgi:hypothetical protein